MRFLGYKLQLPVKTAQGKLNTGQTVRAWPVFDGKLSLGKRHSMGSHFEVVQSFHFGVFDHIEIAPETLADFKRMALDLAIDTQFLDTVVVTEKQHWNPALRSVFQPGIPIGVFAVTIIGNDSQIVAVGIGQDIIISLLACRHRHEDVRKFADQSIIIFHVPIAW